MRPPSEAQRELWKKLGLDPAQLDGMTSREASEAITAYINQQKHRIIRERGFAPDVKVIRQYDGAEMVIDHITKLGNLAFQVGGAGNIGQNPYHFERVKE